MTFLSSVLCCCRQAYASSSDQVDRTSTKPPEQREIRQFRESSDKASVLADLYRKTLAGTRVAEDALQLILAEPELFKQAVDASDRAIMETLTGEISLSAIYGLSPVLMMVSGRKDFPILGKVKGKLLEQQSLLAVEEKKKLREISTISEEVENHPQILKYKEEIGELDQELEKVRGLKVDENVVRLRAKLRRQKHDLETRKKNVIDKLRSEKLSVLNRRFEEIKLEQAKIRGYLDAIQGSSYNYDGMEPPTQTIKSGSKEDIEIRWKDNTTSVMNLYETMSPEERIELL